MKNVYKIEVQAQCPVNPTDTDLYQFTIKSDGIIPVEKITAFFAKHAKKKKIFQETLTQACAVHLGATVTSVGFHLGVKVKSKAP